MTRLLITGSRDWTDREAIRRVLAALPPGSVVVIVGRAGWNEKRALHGWPQLVSADAIAEDIAVTLGLDVERYPAEWMVHAPGWCRCGRDRRGHCPAAGPRRNEQMLTSGKPTACSAFPLPSSVGTVDMINRCRRAGVPVTVHGAEGATP